MFNLLDSLGLCYRVLKTNTLADSGMHERVEGNGILVRGRDYTGAVCQS